MNKRYKTAEIVVSAVVLAILIVIATVLSALKLSGIITIPVSAFLLIFTIVTLGFGVYLTVFALIKKGGYELAVATVLNVIGVIALFIALKIYFVITIIVAVAVALLGFLFLFIIKAPKLALERTDEQEGFVPYQEQLKIQKEKEKAEEEPLPEIKSFKE